MRQPGIYFYESETAEIGRRVREMDAHSSTMLRSPPPSYDPIFTPLFTAAFSSSLFGFSAATAAFLASAASAITVTALTPGIQIVRPK